VPDSVKLGVASPAVEEAAKTGTGVARMTTRATVAANLTTLCGLNSLAHISETLSIYSE
jgi:hypothetical protein